MDNSQRILDGINRAAPIGFGIIKDRVLVQVNSRLCHILGFREDELIGRTSCSLYVDEEEYHRVGRELYPQIEEAGTGNLKARVKSKEGKILDFILSVTLLDPADPSKGHLFTAVDITAQVAAQAETEKIISSMGNVIAQNTEWLNDNNRKLQLEVDKRIGVERQLRVSKKELEATVAQLQRTQAQIIQSEKMASIGQLAAGVAHEINNPTAYVSSNLKTLAEYQEQLGELLETHEALLAGLESGPAADCLPPEVKERVAEARQMAATIDLEFLCEDFPQVIAESREGVERIRKIVADLKDFAHPGDESFREADINQGLDSTINIVWNEIKYKAELTKDYETLPSVVCNVQQLNQVFMNLLVNAAQAIEKDGLIQVCTRHRDGWVVVTISDNGCGIPEEIRNRVFDPFFTTKEIGKGTGLGLSLAYSIIEKHEGTIAVESREGEGTTFTIRLPAA